MSTSRIDGVKAEAGRQTNTVSSAAAMLVENRFIYKLKVVGQSRCCGQHVQKTANRANQNGSDGGKLRPTGNDGRSRGRHGCGSKSAVGAQNFTGGMSVLPAGSLRYSFTAKCSAPATMESGNWRTRRL